MTRVALALVSHTNVGKTTLARTLLGREIGEVRDAPHVTEYAETHTLLVTEAGDELALADTPGFGDSVRLARRLQQRANPLGWFLAEVWDRWRDRPFWASQQALRHVQADADALLYLVNAAERPEAAAYVDSEMEILAWIGKPVLVLLNQLGAPRASEEEAVEVERWQRHLGRFPHVKAVLPLDAFARCWVQELVLLDAVSGALDGNAAAAMRRLAATWAERRRAIFDTAVEALAASLARIACAREAVDPARGLGERWRRLLGSMIPARDAEDPAAQAQARLAAALDEEVRASTAALIALHGLEGRAEGEILLRVGRQFETHERVSEGRAAMLGGAITGALAGLKADLATGGLTLGGGLLAGGLLGALGAAGLARGINVVRGTDRSWVAWNAEALMPLVEAALLRYLAVAHFGRGRGEWVQGEAPPHWPAVVAEALAPRRAAFEALWKSRSTRWDSADDPEPLARALAPLLRDALADTLARLYPGAAAAVR